MWGETMKTSETLTELTKSLGVFQKECPVIKKNATGYGYNYATFDSIVDTVKPLLLKHGIVLIQSVGANQVGILLTTRLQHLSGEWIEDSFILPATQMKGVNNVQALGASITYGKRYGISAMLGIATDDDTDGINHQQNNQQKGRL